VIRPAALVALAAVLLGAAPAAARHPRDPREAFTSADQARARRITLRLTDLPATWDRLPPRRLAELRCPGGDADMSDLTLTGKAISRDFNSGTTTALGGARVFRTTREAATYHRRAPKVELGRCYVELFGRGLEPGDTIELVSSRVVQQPSLGPDAVSVHIVWRQSIGGVTFVVRTDEYLWRRGRTWMDIGFTGTDVRPSPALERRVIAAIDERARR
jgi:hypothetical protein